MKTTLRNILLSLLFVSSFWLVPDKSSAQSCLYFFCNTSDKPYIVLSDGTVPSPVFLVVNQAGTSAIIVNSDGGIISEGDGNFVKWNTGASMGIHTVPFMAFNNWWWDNMGGARYDKIPFDFDITSSVNNNFWVSTYHTGSDNTTWSYGVTNMASVWGGSADSSVIDRWWRVNTEATVTASMNFNYLAGENLTTQNPIGSTQAQQWDDIIDAWLAPIGPGVAGVGSGFDISGAVPSGSTNNFGRGAPWVLVRKDDPLPVKLLEFNAYCAGSSVELEWATASESNNDYFTVQRSPNGTNFEDVTIVNGAGNSNQLIHYHATDHNPLNNDSYYRLKQTDYNGLYTYSAIVHVGKCVEGSSTESTNIFVYFDPGNEALNVMLGDYSGTATVAMRDILGKQLTEKKVYGDKTVSFDIGYLSYGIYFVVIQTEKETITKKVYIAR